jgi:hypothetical protein
LLAGPVVVEFVEVDYARIVRGLSGLIGIVRTCAKDAQRADGNHDQNRFLGQLRNPFACAPTPTLMQFEKLRTR